MAPQPLPGRLTAAILLGFAGIFLALRVGSFVQKSATFDEPVHLASGYAALADRDFRFDPTHPPLIRMWAALPLFVLDPAPPNVNRISQVPAAAWMKQLTGASQRFLFQRNDADRLLNPARFMIALAGVGLGVLVFLWSFELFGLRVALLALLFYTLVPEISAHAALVTTDLGLAAFTFAAVYFLWRADRRFSWWNVLGATLAVGGALATKFSGVLLLPISALLLAAGVWRRPETWRRSAGVAAVIAAGGFAIVWAAYGFRYAPSGVDGWLFHFESLAMVQNYFGAWLPWFQWIDARHLLPNAFTQGFLFSQASAGEIPAYLAGRFSPDGFWYYFPVAVLIKTPLSLLLLAAFGVGALVSGRKLIGWTPFFVLAPVLVFMGAAMASDINLGVRHVLPIYPFLVMVAAAAAWKLMASGRAGRAVLAVVAVYWAVQYARVYPDSLGYFNSLVGGPRYGAEYLADSNLDWGQDLKPLKRWMDDHGVAHVNLAYFGTSDPKYYGIDFTRLPISTLDESQYERPQLPGYVAISVTEEIGVYQPRRWRLFYQGLRHLTPSATIGSSIKVYWLDRWPIATPGRLGGTPSASDLDGLKSLADTLSRLRWFNQAARHYRRYLEFRPDDAAARLALSAAFLQAARYSEAETAARDVIADTPDNAAAFDLLGRALASSGRIDEAIEAFERALEIDPEMSAAGDALAIVRRARPAMPPPPPPADRRDRWRLLI